MLVAHVELIVSIQAVLILIHHLVEILVDAIVAIANFLTIIKRLLFIQLIIILHLD